MRFPSLDMFRGFVVLFMIFINLITLFSYDLPYFLQHNLTTMLPGDLVAPLFQFIIGISLVIAIEKRKNVNERRRYVLQRTALLLLLGLALDAGFEKFAGLRWGVLESLGIGILLSYALLSFSVILRIAATLGILTIYSILFFHVPKFSSYVLSQVHGGPLGAVSYATVAVFGTIAGEWLYTDGKKKKVELKNIIMLGAIIMFLSFITNFFVPFNRLSVSASYMLFSAGIGFLLVAAFYYLAERKHFDNHALTVFGQNALIIWVLHYLLFWWPLTFFLNGGCCFLPWQLGLAVTVMGICLFYVIADIVGWKKIRIPI